MAKLEPFAVVLDALVQLVSVLPLGLVVLPFEAVDEALFELLLELHFLQFRLKEFITPEFVAVYIVKAGEADTFVQTQLPLPFIELVNILASYVTTV